MIEAGNPPFGQTLGDLLMREQTTFDALLHGEPAQEAIGFALALIDDFPLTIKPHQAFDLHIHRRR